MAIQILRDLRGLRVHVVHPPDAERTKLVEHLRRIGCMAETQWPVPDCWAEGADIVINLVGISAKLGAQTFEAVHVAGARAVAKAASEATAEQ